jgi:C4-dicarboxylate transporter DctM subunit
MITVALIVITIMALCGAPIFIVLSAYAITGFVYAEIPLAAITVDVYSNFSSNPLLYTIPLFTFAGYILAESKTSTRIVNLSKALLGIMPGGLAIVALVTCAFFTAFTGASGVTIIALGGLLFPALHKEKYPENFSLGLLTSSGSLGLLFAPSLPLIMYSVVSETSIIQIFTAGLIPGILLIILLSMYSIFIAKKENIGTTPFKFNEAISALKKTKWELFIPVIIIGGLFGGIVTLGEVATVVVVYALFIEVVIYKDIPIRRIPIILNNSIKLTGGMLIIMGAAYSLTNYMVDAEVPLIILDFIKSYISSKIVFLIVLNIFLLVVGCLLDIYSAIFVVVPLIIPIAKSYDVNLVHLGIIFLANLEIGYSTPPVGMNLFIACLRFKKPVLSLYNATIPFILILMVGLLLITYVPFLSLGLIDFFHIK